MLLYQLFNKKGELLRTFNNPDDAEYHALDIPFSYIVMKEDDR